MIFDEVMNFPVWAFLGTLKNAAPRNLNIPTVYDVTWGTSAKIGHFCGAYLPREIDLKKEGITCRKILLDLFWRKNDRWVQKSGSRDLKTNTTSGMTSSIRNLGKFGQIFKMTNFAELKKMGGNVTDHFYVKWGGEYRKCGFGGWMWVQRTPLTDFWEKFVD